MRKLLYSAFLTFLLSNTFCQTLDKSPASLTTGEGEKKVIVRGVGNDRDAALKNCFENAVNEAIGALISSETRIENDALIKDEIRLYSKGFIKTYKILSELQTNDKYEASIAAIVTEKQIFESLKAKGVAVVYSTEGMFAQIDEWENLKQNEVRMGETLFNISDELSNKNPFDYSLTVSDPQKITEDRNSSSYNRRQVPGETNYMIPMVIEYTPNANYWNYVNEFQTTLTELAFEKVRLQYEASIRDAGPRNYAYTYYSINYEQLGKSKSRGKDIIGIVAGKQDDADLYTFDFRVPPPYQVFREVNNTEVSRFNDAKLHSDFTFNPDKIAYIFRKGYSPYILMLIDGSDKVPEGTGPWGPINNKTITCYEFINLKTADIAIKYISSKLKIFRCKLKITFTDATEEEIVLNEANVENAKKYFGYDAQKKDYSISKTGRIVQGYPYEGFVMFFDPQLQKKQAYFALKYDAEKLRKIKEIKIEPL